MSGLAEPNPALLLCGGERQGGKVGSALCRFGSNIISGSRSNGSIIYAFRRLDHNCTPARLRNKALIIAIHTCANRNNPFALA